MGEISLQYPRTEGKVIESEEPRDWVASATVKVCPSRRTWTVGKSKMFLLAQRQ